MKKKILILGASGFIGRNLAEFFAARDDFEVYGTCLSSQHISHAGVKMVRADLTRREDMDAVLAGMDVVIQAAAVTSGSKDIHMRPYTHITDNALMNSLLFRAAFEQEIPHVLLLSCSIMYQSSDTPRKESDFDACQEMFPSYFGGGWNKVYFEKMCEFFSRMGKSRYTVIRHSNMYGPWDKFDLERSHVFGATITKVMTAPEDGTILVWGSGEEGRDLLYIDDLASFIYSVIERQSSQFEIYNVGSGTAIPVRDLVQKIVECTGKKLTIVHDLTKPTIKFSLSLDCGKAYQQLGWKPEISLEEGIRRTLAWYREHYPCHL
ncbi:MAG: NAD(P)-dependent oxidoreductase [Desulfuromonadales bacterium]